MWMHHNKNGQRTYHSCRATIWISACLTSGGGAWPGDISGSAEETKGIVELTHRSLDAVYNEVFDSDWREVW